MLGLYGDLEFTEKGRCSPDTAVSLPSFKRVAHYGAFGYWASDGDHRFVIYMMPTDISKALLDGSVQFSVGSEVSSMSATFQNIRGESITHWATVRRFLLASSMWIAPAHHTRMGRYLSLPATPSARC